LVNKINY